MKSIFLCENKDALNRVYSTETIERLGKTAGIKKEVYTKADILKHPNRFQDTEYIFSTWGMPVFTQQEINTHFPNLKCVFYGAGTVQAFARPFLNCGVRVFSAWAANAVPVAEYTTAQIVLGLKGFFTASRLLQTKGREEARRQFSQFPGIYQETVGIIGAGMIGKMVIRQLKALELNCLVFDPFLPDDTAKELGAEKCSLEHLFQNAFIISNHLANNAQTKGMLTYKHFASMRQNAVFINTGRGAQVVEEDLVQVLASRPDITALLDVTDPEPPVQGHKFYTLSNCILTPHIAGSSGNEVHRMANYMCEEFERIQKGAPCLYEVTPKMLETMA